MATLLFEETMVRQSRVGDNTMMKLKSPLSLSLSPAPHSAVHYGKRVDDWGCHYCTLLLPLHLEQHTRISHASFGIHYSNQSLARGARQRNVTILSLSLALLILCQYKVGLLTYVCLPSSTGSGPGWIHRRVHSPPP